ncbi:MAG TPA: type II toxin-antitoxin system RelE/ParE family toxin [Bryobacteraceae bacterium]|nr:type II toxin-antitoxin system RelE/ParE family toxin [Bryobacteraceae bacterium]
MTDPAKHSFTLEFTPAALREVTKLDSSVRRKVFSDIEKLQENPRPQGVERLETREKLYRVYVGPGKNYRAIYQIRDEILLVLVVKVGDRKGVYRRVK